MTEPNPGLTFSSRNSISHSPITQDTEMSDTANTSPSLAIELASLLSEFTDVATSAALSLTAAAVVAPKGTLVDGRLQDLANALRSLGERARAAGDAKCSERNFTISDIRVLVERLSHQLECAVISSKPPRPLKIVEDLFKPLLVISFYGLLTMASEGNDYQPEKEFALVASFIRFILENSDRILAKVEALLRKKSGSSYAASMSVVRQLIEEVRKAGVALRDEASTLRNQAATETDKPANAIESDGSPSKRRSSLPLFHGTSATILRQILTDGVLRTAEDPEDPDYSRISMTTDRSVAEYFACGAAIRDGHDLAEEPGAAVVLELDGRGLAALFHDLDTEESNWEHEVKCRNDIKQLERLLIATEPVPPERVQDYERHGPRAFMPTILYSPSQLLQTSR